MAQTADTDCLYSTLRNTSGHEQFFGFLGAHGKRLAANESYSVPGDLNSKLGNTLSQRRFNSFKAALQAGDLALLSTPAVHLHDMAHDVVRVLALNNNELGFVDPCYASEGSATFEDPDI